MARYGFSRSKYARAKAAASRAFRKALRPRRRRNGKKGFFDRLLSW